ncbi:MAG: SGNH/GDSL hydrolase family protein [Lachnospiraceae bacterium]|nr:SGNH/GDSL hydrolase family protein [Lachnospiraceae bacterium]
MDNSAKQKTRNNRKNIILAAILLAAAVILLLIILGATRKPDSNKEAITELFAEKEEIVIDCLGDSITFGLYRDVASPDFQSQTTYPESLEEGLNQKLKEASYSSSVIAVNDGISGDVITKDTYQRVTCSPDIVVLLYSGNNFHFNIPYKGALEANIKEFKERGTVVYLANYPLYPDSRFYKDFSGANNYIKKSAQKTSVPLIDIDEYFSELVNSGTYEREELFSKDLVHLTPLGYQLLGEKVSDIIFNDIEK